MPVHIDQIDTEIEMTPREERAGGRASAQPATTSSPGMGQTEFRRAVVAALESELDEYLRMRG